MNTELEAWIDFERFLDATLGEDGVIVSMVEAYFNDSGTHPTSPVLCVAGYVFDKQQAINFDCEWRALLKVYRLPFFRMSACAYGAEPFDKLSPDERAGLEQNMVAIINKWMCSGIAVTVEPGKPAQVQNGASGPGESPFRCCARFVLAGTRQCLEEKRIAGDCAYVFESGHRSHAEAHDIMNRLYLDAKQRRAHRYLSHTFVGNTVAPPLQAADLLAWHWYTERRRKARGDGAPRPGTKALLDGDRRGDYNLLHQ